MSSPSICESCQLGKSKKLPFFASATFTVRPLELVHTDVWGLALITSISGVRFYVNSVDDYSRYCWIFPLHSKSDVYEVFLSFKAKVENLLDNKIKMLRSDGEGECTSTHFEKFLSSCGITLQITCPHTLKQNGIPERKHRHIVETGLTLLAHSHMPMSYWLEAFNSVVFLINRMPTPILSKLSPWEKLFTNPLLTTIFARLDVLVTHGSDLMRATNWIFDQSSVSSLAIASIIRAIGVLTLILDVSIFLATWCLMNIVFHFKNLPSQ